MTLLAVSVYSVSSYSFTSKNSFLCSELKDRQKDSISTNFDHNPFETIETLVKISHGNFDDDQKNLAIERSFDLGMIFRQTQKHHDKSSAFKTLYMNKIKNDFYGLYSRLFKEPTKTLMSKHKEQMSTEVTEALDQGSIIFTNLSRYRCTSVDKSLLGCSGGYYVLYSTLSPELSCNTSDLKDAYQVKFFLSYNKKYGFKIVDVEMSGTRIVLKTFKYIDELKSRGYNREALISRFKSLEHDSKSFVFPSRLTHSRAVMAITESDKSRLPSSLEDL